MPRADDSTRSRSRRCRSPCQTDGPTRFRRFAFGRAALSPLVPKAAGHLDVGLLRKTLAVLRRGRLARVQPGRPLKSGGQTCWPRGGRRAAGVGYVEHLAPHFLHRSVDQVAVTPSCVRQPARPAQGSRSLGQGNLRPGAGIVSQILGADRGGFAWAPPQAVSRTRSLLGQEEKGVFSRSSARQARASESIGSAGL